MSRSPFDFTGCLRLRAPVWLTGFLASMVTRPHRLGPHSLVVRDGIFTELAVPFTWIRGAREAAHPNFGRSGLKVDKTGDALLAVGDANVLIDLGEGQPLQAPGSADAVTVPALRITVDNPGEILARRQAAVARP